MTRTGSTVAAALLSLATTAQAKDLTPADLRKYFPGTYSITIFNSFTLRVSMRGDGQIIGYAKGKRDTGKWSIEGSKLCVAWKSWTGGRKGCSTLRRDGSLLRGRGFYFKA